MQEVAISRSTKSGKKGKRAPWLSRELLVKQKGRKQMRRQWRQGQVTWEEVKFSCVGKGVRKAKMKLELHLAGDSKNNKKGFYV